MPALKWVLEQFAQFENNFQMVGESPFLSQDLVWYKQAITFLQSQLDLTGKMTFELETELKELTEQQVLLEGSQPLYLVKRLLSTGAIEYRVSPKRGADPLANSDEAHIPVGE